MVLLHDARSGAISSWCWRAGRPRRRSPPPCSWATLAERGHSPYTSLPLPEAVAGHHRQRRTRASSSTRRRQPCRFPRTMAETRPWRGSGEFSPRDIASIYSSGGLIQCEPVETVPVAAHVHMMIMSRPTSQATAPRQPPRHNHGSVTGIDSALVHRTPAPATRLGIHPPARSPKSSSLWLRKLPMRTDHHGGGESASFCQVVTVRA